ncbi:MAG: ACT domain-containing protein [Lachnospiraceae bacterium]|jgi:hypothetical protein|nr:ACT domain-containing protein [Lachnospiraceae bacterium]
MQIRKIAYDFSVCKVTDYSLVDWNAEYCFMSKTKEENSLVCITDNEPPNVTQREEGWKAFRVEGILDFTLIGILSKISGILAEHHISIFAISTFNTDYVLIKRENYQRALDILEAAGYEIIE